MLTSPSVLDGAISNREIRIRVADFYVMNIRGINYVIFNNVGITDRPAPLRAEALQFAGAVDEDRVMGLCNLRGEGNRSEIWAP